MLTKKIQLYVIVDWFTPDYFANGKTLISLMSLTPAELP
ncbi:hypothetical protein BH11BAC3_BH11BAC3_20140 [soil metagenome]